MIVEPELTGFGLMAAAAAWGFLAASEDGPGWKKLFGRLGLGKTEPSGGSATTDPKVTSPPTREDWKQTAEALETQGRYREAARIFQGKGQNYEAARLLLKSGALTEAASAFERVGHYQRAAEVCAQAGDNKRAAENYRAYLEDRFGSLAGTRTPADHAEFVHYCRLAGQAFERAGLLEQAAEILERGEHWEQAGALYARLARYVKAADLYQRAGAVAKAADVYAQAGDRVRAAQMRGESLYKQDQKNEAAVQFLLGGDPLRAAEVYEEADNYLDAARCYEHCGAHRQAAEAYQRIGERTRAAEMFGRCQDYEQSAALYEETGDSGQAARMFSEAGLFYRAALAAKKAGLPDLAIAHLQKIAIESPDYQASLVELASHFKDRGLPGVAVEKLRKAIGEEPLSASNIDLYYAMAEACQEMGDRDRACEILREIVGENYNYRDAVGRLQELERKISGNAANAEEGEPRAESTERSPTKDDVLEGELGGGERYQFVEKLGSGGMGIVYRAKDRLLDRVVAYKMLMEQFMEIDEIRERFLREARSAAKLNHPNIVSIYDMGIERGRLYIIMEFVEGVSYYKILDREDRLPINAVLHFMIGVLKALSHAHAHGVIHRDIKPSNVMLTRRRVVKIADFGLAKILQQANNEGSQRASGTPLYMSPEQILGKPVDFRTDIYAFGGSVFHLLSGEPPFIEGEVLYHHVHTPPRELGDLRPEVPLALQKIVMRCLSKEPDQRFQKPEEILDALRSVKPLT
jgi:tetratricopeptide (TPR) repeat protein/predicted Ser/Thr protein kinase